MRLLTIMMAAWLSVLPGCVGGGDGPDGGAPTSSAATIVDAPWWNVGESWTLRFTQAGAGERTVTMVNFANDTFGDPPHFWLGVADRRQALDHVFFENNPFLGRIHHVLLAPHEKGMHSQMYEFPLEDGDTWTSPILFGHEDLLVTATRRDDGTFLVEGEARADGTTFEYDYDPKIKWFRSLRIAEGTKLDAEVVDHKESGARGTYYFLRGRDYLHADGGTTGEEETFEVKDEGATGIAFLLDVRTSGPSAIEFVDPSGTTVHRQTLALGGSADEIVEIKERPSPGTWKLRYVGSVQGTILVRGLIEYKATI